MFIVEEHFTNLRKYRRPALVALPKDKVYVEPSKAFGNNIIELVQQELTANKIDTLTLFRRYLAARIADHLTLTRPTKEKAYPAYSVQFMDQEKPIYVLVRPNERLEFIVYLHLMRNFPDVRDSYLREGKRVITPLKTQERGRINKIVKYWDSPILKKGIKQHDQRPE